MWPFRWDLVLRTSLFGLVAAGACASAASADPTTLTCSGYASPLTLVLNAGKSVVTVTYSAEAGSSSTNAATFDPATITWADRPSANPRAYERWVLDRTTGKLQRYESLNAPYEQADPANRTLDQLDCRVATPKF